MLTLALAGAASPLPPPPGTLTPDPTHLLEEAVASLPDDITVRSLHWDGRTLWVHGEGRTPITRDGRTEAGAWGGYMRDTLPPSIVAGYTTTTADLDRGGGVLFGLTFRWPHDPAASLAAFESEQVWLDTPRYAADQVTLRGVALDARALERWTRMAALSPCLADLQVTPDVAAGSPVPFALTAHALGDLAAPACAPSRPLVDATPATVQSHVQGDWSTVLASLRTPSVVPLETFTITPEAGALVLQSTFFSPPVTSTRKHDKALKAHTGTPTPELTARGLDSRDRTPDGSPFAFFGDEAPSRADTMGLHLVERHKNTLHRTLQGLDTLEVDLRDVRLRAVVPVHAQVVQLAVDVQVVGPPEAIAAMWGALDVPGLTVQPLSASAEPFPAPGRSMLPVRATAESRTLLVAVPTYPSGPRGLPSAAHDLSPEAPPELRNPFEPVPARAPEDGAAPAYLAGAPELTEPKPWHVQYLGQVGGEHPKAAVRTPNGRRFVVRPGDTVGHAWSRVERIEPDALELLTEFQPPSGPLQRDLLRLPIAPGPPDEAPAPASTVLTVDPAAFRALEQRFSSTKALNIDLDGAELAALLSLYAHEGVPVSADLGGGPVPTIGLLADRVPMGRLLAELQLILLEHDLVFDGDFVLRRDPSAAAHLEDTLLSETPVSIASLALPAEALPVHLVDVDTRFLLKMLRVGVQMTGDSLTFAVSGDAVSRADLLAQVQAHLAADGRTLCALGDRFVVVASPGR